ncbi:YegS/Rv2252/BmrU family lipid kinase [Oxobacter pfennigii]|uniref:YegS/Rv2252/BmrU family lipid kinase n=1 Tax=Oxobacter pfennigii TaxID=36849 RepID=UPI0009FB1441|nr:YegS/Rv2252/BmrU family lipid kinase [Oxobacter pfennigii]
MKKIRLIYNPISGDKSFKTKLDEVIEEFQLQGFQTVPYKTMSIEDIENAVKFTSNDDYHGIAIAGGDGTINRVINAMIKWAVNLPIGIFPWGTANDLAEYFGIGRDYKRCCSIIAENNTRMIDLGKINDRYFINVAAGGLLTDVSQKTDATLKNTLGKLAYYFKGLEQIPSFSPITAEFISYDRVIKDKIYLFTAFNGCSAGGFHLLAKDARIDDGMLDIIAVKACPIVELVTLFIKLLRGEHLNDSNIIYFKTDKITINCECDIETDIDGEAGPLFPVEISVIPRAVAVFAP